MARETRMQQYLFRVTRLLEHFQEQKATQIPREENAEAEALANVGSATNISNTEASFVINLLRSTLDSNQEDVNTVNVIIYQSNDFIDYLQNDTIPKDKKAAQQLKVRARRYCLIEGYIYLRNFNSPLAKCLGETT